MMGSAGGSMNIAEIYGQRRLGRKIQGIAAMLLPFDQKGDIAEEAFAGCLKDTVAAGLTPAVNMDTGYVNLLTDAQRARVLKLAQEALNGAAFVAGAYIEGQNGDLVDLYKREIERIVEHGGTPIFFQTERLHSAGASEIARVYSRASASVETAYAFELGRVFARNGEIWPDDVFEAILQVPQIRGMKHSSLHRVQELRRLKVRDRVRPDFTIFTGNDLG